MKKTMTAIAGLVALTVGSGAADAATLEIVVEGLSAKGRVMIAVLESEEAWKGKSQDLVSINAKATAPTMKFTIDVPATTLAVRLFHDANGNGELDTNMLGIPKEGYGFSNNPSLMGPAAFKDAAFKVSAARHSTTISIQ
ncbi:MAG: DUF2141 domain-containing protein [Myxococcota bacterium]